MMSPIISYGQVFNVQSLHQTPEEYRRQRFVIVISIETFGEVAVGVWSPTAGELGEVTTVPYDRIVALIRDDVWVHHTVQPDELTAALTHTPELR